MKFISRPDFTDVIDDLAVADELVFDVALDLPEASAAAVIACAEAMQTMHEHFLDCRRAQPMTTRQRIEKQFAAGRLRIEIKEHLAEIEEQGALIEWQMLVEEGAIAPILGHDGTERIVVASFLPIATN